MVMSYKVIPIQEKDNREICALYEKAFKQPMCNYNSHDIFLWFYFNNIYCKHYCKGIHNGKNFASYWGFVPLDCKVNGKIYKGSLSFQLVSTKEVLGSTLSLWKKIKDDLINDDVVISFTINRENSVQLLKNIGWNVEIIPILINIVNPFKLINDLISKTISNRVFKKIFRWILRPLDYSFFKLTTLFYNNNDKVYEVRCFDENYNKLWDIMSNSVNNGVNLDARYVNWRYIEKPNNTYKILSYVDGDRVMGYLIYDTKKIFGTHIGFIMDIIADPQNDIVVNSLIDYAKNELFQKGVTIISALSFKENIFYKNLKGRVFFNIPKKLLPQKNYFSINKFFESDNDFEVNKWHISWGNHDNF
jgi:hypothetical protein